MEDIERCTFLEEIFDVLVKLLDMLVCRKLSFGHCMLCTFCIMHNVTWVSLGTEKSCHRRNSRQGILWLKEENRERGLWSLAKVLWQTSGIIPQQNFYISINIVKQSILLTMYFPSPTLISLLHYYQMV